MEEYTDNPFLDDDDVDDEFDQAQEAFRPKIFCSGSVGSVDTYQDDTNVLEANPFVTMNDNLEDSPPQPAPQTDSIENPFLDEGLQAPDAVLSYDHEFNATTNCRNSSYAEVRTSVYNGTQPMPNQPYLQSGLLK
jgi:hypothetical protein